MTRKFSHPQRERIVVILNGPPGSGKDTLAYGMVFREGFKKLQFKDRLNQICAAVAGVNLQGWLSRADNRRTKDHPWDDMNGLTPRQLQIKVSEEWVKPALGKQYFGLAAAEAVSHSGHKVVFSDGGFPEEVAPLLELESTQVHIVRLHREGFTFAGDSRNYVYNTGAIEHDVTLAEGQIDAGINAVLDAVGYTWA